MVPPILQFIQAQEQECSSFPPESNQYLNSWCVFHLPCALCSPFPPSGSGVVPSLVDYEKHSLTSTGPSSPVGLSFTRVTWVILEQNSHHSWPQTALLCRNGDELPCAGILSMDGLQPTSRALSPVCLPGAVCMPAPQSCVLTAPLGSPCPGWASFLPHAHPL